MINWFVQQDPAVKAAVITGAVTIIGGILKLIGLLITKHRTENEQQNPGINITQSTTGNNNTFIGVQNNKGE